MGFVTDYDVITYLERRVKYYKKRIASTKNTIKNPWFISMHGKKQLARMVNKALEHYDDRIVEYLSAIETLSK